MAERARAEQEARKWTQQDELLAINAELVHALLSAFVVANGGKKSRPFRIPRPGQADAGGVKTVSHRDLLKVIEEEVK